MIPKPNVTNCQRTVALTAAIADAFDGSIRILNDAQRFGFDVLALDLRALADGSVALNVTLAVPDATNVEQVCSRFCRHSAVLSLEAA